MTDSPSPAHATIAAIDADGDDLVIAFEQALGRVSVRLDEGTVERLAEALSWDLRARRARRTAEAAIRHAVRVEAGPPGASPTADDPLLARFLADYPGIALESPARLQRAWDGLDEAERHAAVAGLPGWLACLREMRRSTVPSAAAYLLERRWEMAGTVMPAAVRAPSPRDDRREGSPSGRAGEGAWPAAATPPASGETR